MSLCVPCSLHFPCRRFSRRIQLAAVPQGRNCRPIGVRYLGTAVPQSETTATPTQATAPQPQKPSEKLLSRWTRPTDDLNATQGRMSAKVQLVKAITAAEKSNVKKREFWDHAVSALLDFGPSLTAVESIEMLWVLAKMGKLSSDMVEPLARNVKVEMNQVKTAKLVTLLWVLQDCNYKDRTLLMAMAEVRVFLFIT